MRTPSTDSASALAAGPRALPTWARLMAVPILVMGMLTWAFWSPDRNHGTATAAVVNDDAPVSVDGKTIPLGRLLAGNLTHSTGSSYTWILTDAKDATAGLASGHYVAAVTIPADFSARATSAATGTPLAATKAILRVQTSAANGVADPTLATQIAEATRRALNNQIVETYLDNVYIAFGTIHQRLNQAADGAGRLADGTNQLLDAAAQLAGGADQLATGTAELASGSSQLSAGLARAARDTAQLPALTRQLAAGAGQVATGNQQVATAVVPLANRIVTIIDALPPAASAAAALQQLAAGCAAQGGSTQFCQSLTEAADQLASESSTLDSAKVAIRAAVVNVRDSVGALATGARQVADGNSQLAAAMPALTAGITGAASGARRLDTGIRQADTGAHELAAGAGKLRSGTGTADNGARQLATQLDKGRNQVPAYTEAERAHLRAVAADPTTATTRSTPASTLAVTLVAALALWALALATYIVTRPVPAAVLTARAPTWRIILHAAVPGGSTAILAAVAVTAIAAPALRLGAARTFGFLLIALLAALAFTALNQSATAILGRSGRHTSLAVLVLAGATGILSSLPGPLYALTGYLPTHAAVLALRATAAGTPGLLTGTVELVAWLAAGALATIAITDRRRYLSPRHLRRGAPLPVTV